MILWTTALFSLSIYVACCNQVPKPVGFVLLYFKLFNVPGLTKLQVQYLLTPLAAVLDNTTVEGKLIVLGTFATLRKATISFVVYVRLFYRPTVRNEQLGSH
jgi:hypothetical protein